MNSFTYFFNSYFLLIFYSQYLHVFIIFPVIYESLSFLEPLVFSFNWTFEVPLL